MWSGVDPVHGGRPSGRLMGSIRPVDVDSLLFHLIFSFFIIIRKRGGDAPSFIN